MEEPRTTSYAWHQKIAAVLLVMLCALLGIVLVVYPWLPCEPGFPCWDDNYLVNLLPAWSHVWKSAHFRGAISGLGLVNIYVALLEAAELRRFSRHDHDKVPS